MSHTVLWPDCASASANMSDTALASTPWDLTYLLYASDFNLPSRRTTSTDAPLADRKVAPPIRSECSDYSPAGDVANANTPRRAAGARTCVQTDQLSRAVPNAASGAWEGKNIQEDSNSIINSTAPSPSRNGKGGYAGAGVITVSPRSWSPFELQKRTSTRSA